MAHARGNPNAHVPVPIHADISHLSSDEQHVLALLVEAARLMNPIFLEQMNQNLKETDGIFDESRGTNFYPAGMTREVIEAYLDAYPEAREAILGPCTVVERDDDGALCAVAYAVYYRAHLKHACLLLKQAAKITKNASFKTFLESRAKAFLTNAYRQSDIDWVHVSDAPLELTIGPYEDYADTLFGVKRDMEGVVGVVLPEETNEARKYQDEVVAFDAHLGERYGYTPTPTQTPMVVIDEVYASGFARYSYVPMAFNLPNDADIQREVGSKKVFIRNVMYAKMERITKKVAQRVLSKEMAALLEPSLFMRFVIGHESAHGLSFRFEGEDFYELGTSLEEGKADVFGMLFLYFLAERGVIAHDIAERAVIGNLTDGLRQLRFGIEEAHAVGTLVQYNWCTAHDALRVTDKGLAFEPKRFKEVLDELGDELYALSQTRDHKAAQRFVREWGSVPDAVRTLTESLGGIPVDIDPQFSV